MPQTSGFLSAKQILAVSFATQVRACILSDRNIFYTPGGGRTTAGSNAPGAFLVTPPSGRSLVIPLVFHFYYPAIRMESSNTLFCFFTLPSGRGLVIPIFHFFGGHLPQTSLGQTNMSCKLSVNISNVSSCLGSTC